MAFSRQAENCGNYWKLLGFKHSVLNSLLSSSQPHANSFYWENNELCCFSTKEATFWKIMIYIFYCYLSHTKSTHALGWLFFFNLNRGFHFSSISLCLLNILSIWLPLQKVLTQSYLLQEAFSNFPKTTLYFFPSHFHSFGCGPIKPLKTAC